MYGADKVMLDLIKDWIEKIQPLCNFADRRCISREIKESGIDVELFLSIWRKYFNPKGIFNTFWIDKYSDIIAKRAKQNINIVCEYWLH